MSNRIIPGPENITGGGVTDHGVLTGLGDDDHAQYLLVDGTRGMPGAIMVGLIGGGDPINPTVVITDPGNGIYRPSANEIAISTGGAAAARWDSSQSMHASAHLYMGIGQHIALDDDRDTYISATANNLLQTVVGTINVQEMFSTVIRDYVQHDTRVNSVGVSASEGSRIYNNTAAALGAQQYSPMTVWEGSGWKTDATAASQSVKFAAQMETIQGAAAPSSRLAFKQSVNGGAYRTLFDIGDSESFSNTASAHIGPSTGSGEVIFGSSGNVKILATSSSFRFFLSTGQWHVMGPGYLDLNSAIDSSSAPVIRIDGVNAGVFSPAPSTFAISTAQLEAVRFTAGQNTIIAGHLSINTTSEATLRALFVDWQGGSGGIPVATIRRNAVGDITVPTNVSQTALQLENITAATATVDQASPLIDFAGAAWSSTTLASVAAHATIGLTTAAAATEGAISADLSFFSQVGSGAWLRTAYLTESGRFYPEYGVVIAGNTANPGLAFTADLTSGISYSAAKVQFSYGGIPRANYDSSVWDFGVALTGTAATFSGDLDAAGGFRRSLDATWLNSPVAGTTYTTRRDGALLPSTEDDQGWHVCARSGSTVEFSAWADAAVAVGQIDFWVEVSGNGGSSWASFWGSAGTPIAALKSGTGAAKVTTTTQAKDVTAFSAGDVLRVRCATAASFSAGRRIWAQLSIEA